MPIVTFIDATGAAHPVETSDGQSVMEAATSHLIPGILADCGGACACATCHVYVDAEWQARAGIPDEMEDAMLDMVIDRQPGSRLSCQIKLGAGLDGLVVRLPESQV